MIQGALTQAPPFSKAVTLKHGEKVKDLLASKPKRGIWVFSRDLMYVFTKVNTSFQIVDVCALCFKKKGAIYCSMYM